MSNSSEQYDWSVDKGHSPDVVAHFVAGYSGFYDDRNHQLVGFGGYMQGGVWGLGSGQFDGGNDLMPLPSHVKVRWFSVYENQFWDAEFDLPKERIEQLFQTGYTGLYRNMRGVHDTYDGFLINVAPNGMVVVWLKGFQQIEIGRFQARKVDMDWADFLATETPQVIGRTREAHVAEYVDGPDDIEIKKQIKAGIPFTTTRWDNYRVKYPYELVVAPTVQLVEYMGLFVNQEAYVTFPADLQNERSKLKPALESVALWVKDANGQRQLVRVKLSADESAAIFTQFFAGRSHIEPLPQLYITLDFKDASATVELKDATHKMSFKHVEVADMVPVREGWFAPKWGD